MLLQCIWCCRSIVMPVLAGFGTAASFTAVDNASDIALNAVPCCVSITRPLHLALRRNPASLLITQI